MLAKSLSKTASAAGSAREHSAGAVPRPLL